MAKILKADPLYTRLKEALKKEIQKSPAMALASLRICEAYCSDVYYLSQKKLAQELGVEYVDVALAPDTTLTQALDKIEECNRDPRITGIIANKPFPQAWNEEAVFSRIERTKDIEGMHPFNLGKLVMGEPLFVSPTVLSTLEFLKMAQGDLYGKEIVIVGFSSLIGKPLALLLGKQMATVTITHIATFERQSLPEHLSRADVIISAVGKPNLIKGEWIKQGAIVIDVGIGELDGKIAGDIEFESVSKKASFITSVPGGVGKLTTLFLFKNLLAAAGRRQVSS